MGFSELWSRTLVYFGIAEDEEWDDELMVTDEEVERDYRRQERANVRRLPRRREPDGWSEADSAADSEANVVEAPPPRSQPSLVPFAAVRPDHFETTGTRVVAGRVGIPRGALVSSQGMSLV